MKVGNGLLLIKAMVPDQVATAEHGFYDTVVCSIYLIPVVVYLFITESLSSMKGLAGIPLASYPSPYPGYEAKGKLTLEQFRLS